MTATQTDIFTVELKGKRPLVLEGRLLASASGIKDNKRPGYGQPKKLLVRLRLIQATNGMIAYDWRQTAAGNEVAGEPDELELETHESAVWDSLDAMPTDKLWGAVKALLREAGHPEMTYEDLDEGPYTATITRDYGRDVRFHGEILAEGKTRVWSERQRMRTDAAVTVCRHERHGYLVFYHCDGLIWMTCEGPAEVYACLVWRDGRPGLLREYDDAYPEPSGDVQALLEALAAKDPDFHPVAHIVPGSDDPVAALWNAERTALEEEKRQAWERRVAAARAELAEALRTKAGIGLADISAEQLAEVGYDSVEEMCAAVGRRHVSSNWLAEHLVPPPPPPVEDGVSEPEQIDEPIEVAPPAPRVPSPEERARAILISFLDHEDPSIKVRAAAALYVASRHGGYSSYEEY